MTCPSRACHSGNRATSHTSPVLPGLTICHNPAPSTLPPTPGQYQDPSQVNPKLGRQVGDQTRVREDGQPQTVKEGG